MPDLLPSSFAKVRRGVVRGLFPLLGIQVNWVPIFCANCGKQNGLVPEENTTFAFWLCGDCEEKWAPLAGTVTIPDKVFWQRVHDEQIERYGRVLNPKELLAAAESPCTALGKLLREGK